MKMIYSSLAALALLAGAAMADTPGCKTNWIGGACGAPSNGGIHQTDNFNTPPLREKPDCEEHEDKEKSA